MVQSWNDKPTCQLMKKKRRKKKSISFDQWKVVLYFSRSIPSQINIEDWSKDLKQGCICYVATVQEEPASGRADLKAQWVVILFLWALR